MGRGVTRSFLQLILLLLPFCHPREEYIAMAILHMTNAVSFLNNDCKLVRCSDR